MNPAIVLATLNARYRHPSLGLRWLMANLGSLRSRAVLLEFDLEKSPGEMAETILGTDPTGTGPLIVGLGVYIWNVEATLKLVRLLKAVRPEIRVVLGGPEVSHEWSAQAIVAAADHLISGPGEGPFQQLCARILDGDPPPPGPFAGAQPPLPALLPPYDLYDAQDIACRVIYVEASRGCPFRCAFCLSALDRTVEPFPLDPFLAQMSALLARGAARFKFVDRTFNLKSDWATAILDFFLDRLDDPETPPGLFLHFEMVPDRLPDALRERIQRFPPGALQLEIGVQSFHPETLRLIERPHDPEQSSANLRWLRAETHAHLHTDLIIGLPGEDLAQFGAGFDRLAALDPHEIQVGVLKRLRGAPLNRLSAAYGMLFDPNPPYPLLANDRIDFFQMRRLQRFARYWDLIGNSGRFPHARRLILGEASPFERFLALSDWLFQTTGRTHKIALGRLQDLVEQGLTEAVGVAPGAARETVGADRARKKAVGSGLDRQARVQPRHPKGH